MDEDEEIWFNEEDSFEDASADTSPPSVTSSQLGNSAASNVITFESIGKYYYCVLSHNKILVSNVSSKDFLGLVGLKVHVQHFTLCFWNYKRELSI